MSVFDDKTILITGGTGSFGKKFTEVLLQKSNPRSVRIFSRGELLQMEMQKLSDDRRLRFLIGDVRDRQRIYRAMNGVDIVVHAAALKQVPACEYNPIEAVRTNIDGSINVIDAAIDNCVEKVIAISTDKAVHPVNLYGATKMVAEKLFIQANTYTGAVKTKFSCVRYGNVVGSRGSVLPLFNEQKTSGVLTITDNRMTRFLLTLDQGVNFVLGCLEMMQGGEIFVPKIPSVYIMDLADVIAPDAKKKVVGIRPGEKLHEVLLTEDESRHTKEFETLFIIEPEHACWEADWGKTRYLDGKILQEGYRYTSENNTIWLSKDELKEIVENPD